MGVLIPRAVDTFFHYFPLLGRYERGWNFLACGRGWNLDIDPFRYRWDCCYCRIQINLTMFHRQVSHLVVVRCRRCRRRRRHIVFFVVRLTRTRFGSSLQLFLIVRRRHDKFGVVVVVVRVPWVAKEGPFQTRSSLCVFMGGIVLETLWSGAGMVLFPFSQVNCIHV